MHHCVTTPNSAYCILKFVNVQIECTAKVPNTLIMFSLTLSREMSDDTTDS